MCLLPILVFSVLLMFDVVISPFIVLLTAIICCLAMLYMILGPETPMAGHRVEPPTETQAETALPADLCLDDLFRIRSEEHQGSVIALYGELIVDANEVIKHVMHRLGECELTPLLQEDEYKRTRLLFVPLDSKLAAKKPARSPWLNIGLFVATVVTTTWAGATHQGVNLLEEPSRFAVGLPYSLGLMLILGAHELGHYFAARAHGMKVTLPYFIPVPFALGTFGAFIQLKSLSTFGQRRSAAISTAALVTLFFLGLFVWSGLLIWAFVAFFIAGRKGLPPLNDVTRLDARRTLLGAFSFALLLAILIPVPHAFWESLGIHCPYA